MKFKFKISSIRLTPWRLWPGSVRDEDMECYCVIFNHHGVINADAV